MRKNILMVASGSFMALMGAAGHAQEAPAPTTETTVKTATPTETGKGATVVRQTTTTTTTAPDTGVTATEKARVQTVTTPGAKTNTTVTTKTDGEPAHTTVDHGSTVTAPATPAVPAVPATPAVPRIR